MDAGDLLDVADLGAAQFVVQDQEICLLLAAELPDLPELALAQIGGGVRGFPVLEEFPQNLGSGGVGQLRQFGQGCLRVKFAGVDAGQDGPLFSGVVFVHKIASDSVDSLWRLGRIDGPYRQYTTGRPGFQGHLHFFSESAMMEGKRRALSCSIWKTVPAAFLSRPNRFIAVCRCQGEDVRVHGEEHRPVRGAAAPRLGGLAGTGGFRAAENGLLPGGGPEGEPAHKHGLPGPQPGGRGGSEKRGPLPAGHRAGRPWSAGRRCSGIPASIFTWRETAAGAFWRSEGVTLEEGGVCRFPDAPTERGVRHLHGLMEAKRQGYEAAVLFVIQMEDCPVSASQRRHPPGFRGGAAAGGEGRCGDPRPELPGDAGLSDPVGTPSGLSRRTRRNQRRSSRVKLPLRKSSSP